MSCGVGWRRGSVHMSLLLWCRLAAAAPTTPLAWEPPNATGARKSKEKKFSEKNHSPSGTSFWVGRILFFIFHQLLRERKSLNATCPVRNIIPDHSPQGCHWLHIRSWTRKEPSSLQWFPPHACRCLPQRTWAECDSCQSLLHISKTSNLMPHDSPLRIRKQPLFPQIDYGIWHPMPTWKKKKVISMPLNHLTWGMRTTGILKPLGQSSMKRSVFQEM